MFKNYQLIKTSDLEAMRQDIAVLNDAVIKATDMLARYETVVDSYRKLVMKQQKQIHELIGIDLDLDFPNSMKGGYQDQ